jgi:competence protein ComGC
MQQQKQIHTKKENGVTLSMIIITIFFISLVSLLALPKIYLHNQIYYESREIANYRNVAQTLREEHSIILHKLEAIKFKENIEKQE